MVGLIQSEGEKPGSESEISLFAGGTEGVCVQKEAQQT